MIIPAPFRARSGRSRRTDEREATGAALMGKIKLLNEDELADYKLTSAQLDGLAQHLGIFDDAKGLAVPPKKALVTEFLVDNQMLRRTRPSRR